MDQMKTIGPWAGVVALTICANLGLLADSALGQDCNGNGVDDGQDIAEGTSNDCNDNGVPDECDFGPEHVLNDDLEWAGAVYAADIDGDRDIDVLARSHLDGRVTWWENANGDGTVWIERDVDTEYEHANGLHAADIDGDGDLDILGGSGEVLDEITWWDNVTGDGTVWVRHTIGRGVANAEDVYGADLDGDGDIDVIGVAAAIDRVIWWENTKGDGTVWITHLIDNDFNLPLDIHAADVDGDEDMDVLGAAQNDDSITWWDNSAGDGSVWIRNDIVDDFDGARSVHPADVDGDGDLDVLGAAFDDAIAWWENAAGDGALWVEHIVDEDFTWPNGVYAADFDDDGDMDVLGIDFLGDAIAWWENTTGDGAVWIEHTIDDGFGSPNDVHAADLDGDGDIDVLGAGQISNLVTWWENDLECLGCLGDLDCDCSVGTGDLIMLLGAWGDPYDTEDLIDLLGNWGPCGK